LRLYVEGSKVRVEVTDKDSVGVINNIVTKGRINHFPGSSGLAGP